MPGPNGRQRGLTAKKNEGTFIKEDGDFQYCDCSSSYITTYLSRFKRSCRFKIDDFFFIIPKKEINVNFQEGFEGFQTGKWGYIFLWWLGGRITCYNAGWLESTSIQIWLSASDVDSYNKIYT